MAKKDQVRTLSSKDRAVSVLSQKMDRKGFIKQVGTGLIAVAGVSAVANMMGAKSVSAVVDNHSDADFTLQDDGDVTKQAKFQLSGITTGTTRTLTVPNTSTTIVGTDAAQTLTNKTISGSSNTITNITAMLAPCRVGVEGPSYTYTISGGTVTQIAGTTLAGVSVSIGDRILVTGAPASSGAGTWGTNQPANGIYVVTGNTTNISLARASDFSGSAIPWGTFVNVIEGSSWGQYTAYFSGSGAFTWGTTPLTYNSYYLSTGVVDRTTPQTLSAKTLDNTTIATVKDANFTIQDDGDTSKQAKFQASGITTGTTRTYTLPDASGTLALASTSTFINVKDYGAVGDGSTNDRAALASADTAAQSAGSQVMFPVGTYRISTSLTVNSPVVFQPGAKIKPDSAVTVTLAGGLTAPLTKVFDHSAGGLVVPKNVDFYRPNWWGLVNTTNDSQAWIDMAAALNASVATFSSISFGQRVLAPTGISRIIGVTLANCEIFAGRGVSCFLPPAATTSGVMLTLGDYTQLNGGWFGTDVSTQAVTCIYQQGYRSQVDDVYIANKAANSVGLQMGTNAVGSTTPVANNIRINSGQATPAAGSIGLDVQSPDAELTNVWVAQHNIGIRGSTAGATRMSNVHVWSNNTGISGAAWDKSQWTNVYIESNRGWGADIDKMDHAVWNGVYVWNNGGGIASTGGMRFTQVSGAAHKSKLHGVVLDDNVGTNLLIDGPDEYDIDCVLSSSLVQQGGSVVPSSVGVQINSNVFGTRLLVKGNEAATPLVDSSGSTVILANMDALAINTTPAGAVIPNIGAVTSSATPAINTDSVGQFNITAQAVAITSMTTNLTGSPVNGQELWVRIKDNGTARSIAWGTKFVAGPAALIITTVASKTHLSGFRYDTTAAKWACFSSHAAGY
jgi:hypothetical protein